METTCWVSRVYRPQLSTTLGARTPGLILQLMKLRLRRVKNLSQDSNPMSSEPYSFSSWPSDESTHSALSLSSPFSSSKLMHWSRWVALRLHWGKRDRERGIFKGEERLSKKSRHEEQSKRGGQEDLVEEKWRQIHNILFLFQFHRILDIT